MADTEDRSAPREIRVPASDTRDLAILSRTDIAFAVLYGALFVIGFVLTLIAV